MGKSNAKADSSAKLQEVILAKTMGSLNGTATTATASAKKATTKKETKKVTAPKEEPKVEKKAKEPKKVKAEREVKYLYPADCKDSLSRKKFRAKIRAEVHQFETKLEKAGEGTKEYKATLKAFKEYKAQYLRG